jgi:uncharacterized membrane protein YdjX (TVP38/TMEM64 family)
MFRNEISLGQLSDILKSYFQLIQTSRFGWALPLVFIIMFNLRPVFLIPTWIMNVVAYVLFGPWQGYFWVIVSETISASTFYFVIKYLAGDAFKTKIINTAYKFGLDLESTQKKELTTVLSLRLASLPFDFTTAFFALSGIRWREMIIGTFVVSLPWAGFFFVTFNSLHKGDYSSGIIEAIAFALFISSSVYIARRNGVIKKKSYV